MADIHLSMPLCCAHCEKRETFADTGGWPALIVPQSEGAARKQWHFCSLACLVNWAVAQDESAESTEANDGEDSAPSVKHIHAPGWHPVDREDS